MLYMACSWDEFEYALCAVLDGMTDPLLFFSAMQEAADIMEHPGMKVKKLYKFLMSTILAQKR